MTWDRERRAGALDKWLCDGQASAGVSMAPSQVLGIWPEVLMVRFVPPAVMELGSSMVLMHLMLLGH